MRAAGGTGFARSLAEPSQGDDKPPRAPPRTPSGASVRSKQPAGGGLSEVSSLPLSNSAYDRLNAPPPPSMLPSTPMFTTREEELQRLVAEERQRSEQRRQNYATLKEEHLRLQSEFLNLQVEVKQIIEETMYFKEKKNEEVEHLLTQIETKAKTIDKLETKLKEAEPEIIKKKLLEELEEPHRRLQREKDRIDRDKESAGHEIKLLRQQIDHLEKEHLDAVERVRLSYEVEVNLVKREKEEIRARLVEASQSPDVARLVAQSEENARLARRLQIAQASMEAAEEQYRAIQKRVEDFVVEHDQKERCYQNEIDALREKVATLKKEANQMRTDAGGRKQEVEELLAEISVLKRLREGSKAEAVTAACRAAEEERELKRKYDKEAKVSAEEKSELAEEIKKLKLELETKNESIDSLEKLVAARVRELSRKTEAVRAEEMEKAAKIVQAKKLIEADVVRLQGDKQAMQTEMETLRNQMETWSLDRLGAERETMLLKVKAETQAASIEELEKIRRQHTTLHDETARLRAEVYDLQAANRELVRIGQNAREELTKAREVAEGERRQRDEAMLSHEKVVARMARRFEEERIDWKERIVALERENGKLRSGAGLGPRPVTAGDVYSRMKARQYSAMADRLNTVLDELKSEDVAHTRPKVVIQSKLAKLSAIKSTIKPSVVEKAKVTIPLEQETMRQELEAMRRKQSELEAYILKK